MSTRRLSLVTASVVTAIVVCGCQTIKTIESTCSQMADDRLCIGTMNVPAQHRALFEQAARQTVQVANDPAFLKQVRIFHIRHAATGQHSAAWAGTNPDQIVQSLQRDLPAIEVTTRRGPIALFYNKVFGNQAWEGRPVVINYYSLPRSSASITNTLIHEAAHGIGLKHPNYDIGGPKDVGVCEPPYVLGALAEKVLLGDKWEIGEGDCALLRDM